MKYLNSKDLYKDEKVLKIMTFTKVPIIILWVCAALLTLIFIIISAVSHNWAMILWIFALLIACGISTTIYLSRELVVTNKRIICRYGLLTVRYLDIPLNKIQSVRCKQTLWQKLIPYGTVIISNSTYGILGYRFNGVTNFQAVKTAIMYALNKYEELKHTSNFDAQPAASESSAIAEE